MWIFCCGMLRSGSTLQYQLTAELAESANIGKRLGYVDRHDFLQMSEKENSDNNMLVVKCHSFLPEAKGLIKDGKAKAIYVYRDVRDVIVSFMNVTGMSFVRILRQGYLETILSDYYKWSSTGDILISKYEEMVKEIHKETLRIANYLGISIDESRAIEFSQKFNIQQQKERIREVSYESIYREYGREDAPEPHSLLKKDHIRSGKPEQWRQALSGFQIAMIESIAYDWLNEQGYIVTQGWLRRQVAKIIYFIFLKIPYSIVRIFKILL